MVAVSYDVGPCAQAASDRSAGEAGTASSSQYVELNVGGMTFCTTVDTLCKDSHSMLAAMFSGRYARPAGAVVFLDRDGSRFTHILNYLRSGTVHLPREKNAYTALLEEADYFGLAGLRELIEEELAAVEEAEQSAAASQNIENILMSQWAGGLPAPSAKKLGSPSPMRKQPQQRRIDDLATCLYQAAVSLVAMQRNMTLNDFRTDLDF